MKTLCVNPGLLRSVEITRPQCGKHRNPGRAHVGRAHMQRPLSKRRSNGATTPQETRWGWTRRRLPPRLPPNSLNLGTEGHTPYGTYTPFARYSSADGR
jgi:hypothetical protein